MEELRKEQEEMNKKMEMLAKQKQKLEKPAGARPSGAPQPVHGN